VRICRSCINDRVSRPAGAALNFAGAAARAGPVFDCFARADRLHERRATERGFNSCSAKRVSVPRVLLGMPGLLTGAKSARVSPFDRERPRRWVGGSRRHAVGEWGTAGLRAGWTRFFAGRTSGMAHPRDASSGLT